jgi:hypothetical protein
MEEETEEELEKPAHKTVLPVLTLNPTGARTGAPKHSPNWTGAQPGTADLIAGMPRSVLSLPFFLYPNNP